MSWIDNKNGTWTNGGYKIVLGKIIDKSKDVTNTPDERVKDVYHCYFDGVYFGRRTDLDEAKNICDL